MKVKNVLFCLLLAAATLLTSCTSIYQIQEETTAVPFDETEEYFTKGNVYKKADGKSGFLYKDYWIYCESIDVRVERHLSNGDKESQTLPLSRVVKVNAKTGTVSSVCLDPVCNHSLFSSCPLLSYGRDVLAIHGIVGDWLRYSINSYDSVTGQYSKTYVYNMQTGELVEIFGENVEGVELIKYTSECVFEDKLYSVKNDLDYSNTKYDPTEDKPLSEYTPETVSTLCEFDFGEKKTRELFRIPDGYYVSAVTNKRFFLHSPEGDIYSCDKSGNDLSKEDVLNFSPQNMCGQYAYNILQDSIEVYDLKTNKINVITHDLVPDFVAITDQGILLNHLTSYDEVLAFQNQRRQFIAERQETMSMSEITQLYATELNKIVYNGKMQVWLFSRDGEKREQIFELGGGKAQVYYAIDGYMYCMFAAIDPETYTIAASENDGRSFVNLETGEVTPIPYMEIESTLYIIEE